VVTDDLLRLRVSRKMALARDIQGFELVHPEGRALPAFTAGAHVDVQVPGGPARQYSLCNDPDETHRYLIAVQREAASRGGSAGMHERVCEGSLLGVSRPRNHFALDPSARRYLLLAGGIGISPILSMVEWLHARGADFELYYTARSRERMAFLERARQATWAPRARLYFDDGDHRQRIDLPALLARAEPGRHVYVCGPRGFMDAISSIARSSGWPAAQLHSESFSAPPSDATGERSFEVLLARSGRVIRVPAGLSVVRALSEAGVFVETSCEQGVCGTCLTRVLEGEPDHRDSYLTDEERALGDQFLPCCSRARSERLVLDR
jgi:vanillate monooxygenase ferredoxin subunit